MAPLRTSSTGSRIPAQRRARQVPPVPGVRGGPGTVRVLVPAAVTLALFVLATAAMASGHGPTRSDPTVVRLSAAAERAVALPNPSPRELRSLLGVLGTGLALVVVLLVADAPIARRRSAPRVGTVPGRGRAPPAPTRPA